jgi:hypothetical protein
MGDVVQVNSDLRSLVFGKSESNLFSFGLAGECTLEEQVEKTAVSNKEEIDLFADLNTQKFFFFHFGRKDKSRLLAVDIEPFCRTREHEQVEQEHEKNREGLTEDYKRKHKSAFKRQKRMKLT